MTNVEIKDKLKQEAKCLYKAAKKLENENLDVCYNNIHYQGHGFEIILNNTWIKVWLNALVTEPSTAIITLFKKNSDIPNYFDPFSCKVLSKKQTNNLNEVYDLVTTLLKEAK